LNKRKIEKQMSAFGTRTAPEWTNDDSYLARHVVLEPDFPMPKQVGGDGWFTRYSPLFNAYVLHRCHSKYQRLLEFNGSTLASKMRSGEMHCCAFLSIFFLTDFVSAQCNSVPGTSQAAT
jgi:hypothetical protein